MSTTGVDRDVDGYEARIGTGTLREPVSINGTATITGVPARSFAFTLADVAGNCSVEGGNDRQITVSAGQTLRLNFSIDCEEIPPLLNKIVFEGCAEHESLASFALWTMNLDGSERTQISFPGDDVLFDGNPAVSPDGKRIAFVRGSSGNAENPFSDLVVMNADGGDDWILRPWGGGHSWSPDGSMLVYADIPIPGVRGSNVYVKRWDLTAEEITITDGVNADIRPSWSPDGSRIVFMSDREESGVWFDIYVMGSDGSNPTRLTHTNMELFNPYWSPDGSKITWSSLRHASGADLNEATGGGEIYVMNADGSNQTRITNNTWHDLGGEWSPDGTRLLLWTEENGPSQNIYLIDPDGSNPVNLTPGNNCPLATPAWSPMSP